MNDQHSPVGTIPQIRLNDGKQIPQLGFGVWQVDNDEVVPAVREALKAGYRSIDTAQGYDNEEGVGRAIKQSGIDRSDIFLTSKIRTKAMGYDEALKGIDASLKALGVDYLDMFLIHWPTPARDTFVDTWKAFIQAQKDGKIRSIGVSNFLPEHLTRIIGETGVKPVVNQLETHPYFQQLDVRDFHKQHNIHIESYSPLGSGAVLEDEVIGKLAKKYGRSPAQVILRWHLQQGLIVIPKSVTPERIRDNLDVFGFELSRDDLNEISKLDDPKEGKTGGDPATFNDLY